LNFSDRLWFNRLGQTRGLVVGQYVIGRISGKATVVVGYPVLNDQGQIQAVLTAGLGLEWRNTFIDTLDLSMGSTVKVIDENGTVLLSNDDPEKLIGKALPNAPLVTKALVEKEDTAQITGLDGTPRQEELSTYREHLGELVRERTAELEAANKEMHAFTYTVSHDLKAPPRHIDGFLELVQKRIETALDEQSRHYKDNISGAAKRVVD
jgi:signal transduction histidine kinase